MKYTDIQGQSAEQLQAQLIELRKEQMNLRFAKAAGQMEKPTRWREVRKAIARVHTAINNAAKAVSKKGA